MGVKGAFIAAALTAFLWQGASAADELADVLSGFDAPAEEAAGQAPDAGLDEVLSGFGDSGGEDGGAAVEEKRLPQWLDPFGSVSLAGSWNYAHHAPEAGETDYRGLSMLKLTLAAGVDLKGDRWRARLSGHGFYDAAWELQGRDQYADGFLDEYEKELEVDEAYISGSLTGSLDLKAGRQVVVWGKADNVRVTDVLNPLDNRTPGMTDIKYRRLPVTMSKLDYYAGDWNLSGIVIHEVRFDKVPVYNSEFYPGNAPAPPEEVPSDFSRHNQQYGLAANGLFRGWDFSAYQAWIFDPRGHVSLESGAARLVHDRVSMTGMTANLASGNWLVKAEAAWWRGLGFATVPGEEFERFDLMAGLEYTGFSETVLSLESVNRHIAGFDDRMRQAPDYAQRDLLQTAFLASRDYANDTVTVKILCTVFGTHAEDGAFERLQVDYDLSDHATVSIGAVLYQSGDQIAFSDIGANDRLFMEYKWAF